MKQDKGFSLIELLVTIMLLSVIVGGGIFNYRRLNARKQVEGAAKQLEQAIRNTQKQATAGVKPAGVCPNPHTLRGYQIELDGGLGSRHYRINRMCNDGMANYISFGTTVQLDQRVVINSGATINFDLLGVAGGDVTVCLRDQDSQFFYRILVTQGGSVSFVKASSC